jgi:hypothetical protein
MQLMPMLSDRSNEVFTYWSGLRHGRAAPSRRQIDPSALRRRLPDLFMLDCQGLDLTFRLAGTRVCEYFGRELNGEQFLALWASAGRDAVTEAALTALRTEEAVSIAARLEAGSVGEACEVLLLPIRSQSHFADRLLGSVILLEPPRFGGIGPGARLALESWRPTRRDLDDRDHSVPPAADADRPLLQRLAEAAGLARRPAR